MPTPIEAFAARLGVTLPEIYQMGRRYFLVNPHLLKMHRATGQDAFSIGLFLGEERGNRFEPSVGFLELLKDTPRRVTIAPETEWLFTCGRDVFEKNIVQVEPEGEDRGMFAVQNNRREILGIGEFIDDRRGGQGRILKNILDIGSFLRKEH
jgi:ribosome biogenesis protein Nip4